MWKTVHIQNNLTQHLQVKHGDPAERPKVPCNECGKNYKSTQCERAFGRSDYLQSHMYSAHGRENHLFAPIVNVESDVAIWKTTREHMWKRNHFLARNAQDTLQKLHINIDERPLNNVMFIVYLPTSCVY